MSETNNLRVGRIEFGGASSAAPIRFAASPTEPVSRIAALEKRQGLLFLWLSEVTTLLHAHLQGDSVDREDLSRLLNAAQATAEEMRR